MISLTYACASSKLIVAQPLPFFFHPDITVDDFKMLNTGAVLDKSHTESQKATMTHQKHHVCNGEPFYSCID